MSRERLAQIDIMKGVAILGVIFTHAVGADNLRRVFTSFHANQAVPIFIALMGFNAMRSLASSKGSGVGSHMLRRLQRLAPPFLVILAVSIVIATLRYFIGGIQPDLGWITLFGYLPYGGPGNYYIFVLVTFTALGPLLAEWYQRNPKLCVGGLLALDLVFELWAGRLPVAFGDSLPYSVAAFRFLGAYAVGMWLAADPGLKSRRNAWLWVFAMVSVVNLAAFQVGVRFPWIQPAWQPLNVLSYGYTGVLVMLGMRFLPSRETRGVWSVLADLGKASYHVFLIQILWFGNVNRPQPIPLLSDLVVPTCAGWLFYKAETLLRSRQTSRSAAAETAA